MAVTADQIAEFWAATQQLPPAERDAAINNARAQFPEVTNDAIASAINVPVATVNRDLAAIAPAQAAAPQGTLAGLQTQPAAASPLDVFKHDFKVDQGGTLTVDGKPLTDQQNAESSSPGTLGWAAAFMTNPAYANFVPAVKQQLAATGTLTPDLAMQIARTGNPNQDDSPFMKALVSAGVFGLAGAGIAGGGLMGENLLSSAGTGASTALGVGAAPGAGTVTLADGTVVSAGNAAGINATGAGLLNTAAGSTTSGILGSGGVFGSGLGVNMTAGQIFAAEQALGTVGKGLLQLAMSKGNTGIATQILAQAAAGAALSAADSRNYTDAINAGKTSANTGANTGAGASNALTTTANGGTISSDMFGRAGGNGATNQFNADGSVNLAYDPNAAQNFNVGTAGYSGTGTQLATSGGADLNAAGSSNVGGGQFVGMGDKSGFMVDSAGNLVYDASGAKIPSGSGVSLDNTFSTSAGAGTGTGAGSGSGTGTGTGSGSGTGTGGIDLTKLLGALGTLASGAAGADASRSYYNTLSDLAKNQWEVGAPSRARYEASMQPGFDPTTIPGYQGTLDSTWKGALAGLSTKGGNPFGNPGGLIQATSDVENKTAAPFLLNYQNQNANSGAIGQLAGGYAGSQASAAAAGGGQNSAYAGTLASLLNPQQSSAFNTSDLTNLLKQLSAKPV